MIVFLTKDLFFVPVLQAAGQKCNTTVATIPSMASPKVETLEAASVTTCVIDLSGTAVEEMESTVQQLRAKFTTSRIVAFGPHVQEGRLKAAESAGCDQVLTRGQLNSQILKLMETWATAMAE